MWHLAALVLLAALLLLPAVACVSLRSHPEAWPSVVRLHAVGRPEFHVMGMHVNGWPAMHRMRIDGIGELQEPGIIGERLTTRREVRRGAMLRIAMYQVSRDSRLDSLRTSDNGHAFPFPVG